MNDAPTIINKIKSTTINTKSEPPLLYPPPLFP